MSGARLAKLEMLRRSAAMLPAPAIVCYEGLGSPSSCGLPLCCFGSGCLCCTALQFLLLLLLCCCCCCLCSAICHAADAAAMSASRACVPLRPLCRGTVVRFSVRQLHTWYAKKCRRQGVGQPTRGYHCSSVVHLTSSQAQAWQARHGMEAKPSMTQATALQAGVRLTYCCAMAATRGSPASSCDGNGNKGK